MSNGNEVLEALNSLALHMNTQDNVSVEVYCPEVPLPELPTKLERNVTSDDCALPPVIVHLRCKAIAPQHDKTTLFDFLAIHTSIPPTLLRDLFEFGAIYARVGLPTPQQSARPSRATLETTLKCGQHLYARIHASPKRHFARLGSTFRVLHDDGELIVVNKPAGLPVCATADNSIECITRIASAHVTHRLDVATCGVLALAKSISVVPRINEALVNAQKRYRVLTYQPPPVGKLRHWYPKRAQRSRGPVAESLLADWNDGIAPSEAGWTHASLVVESRQRVGVESEALWESYVLLKTGRTHQIRVQFAAVGCAIWRDTKYQPVEGKLLSGGKGILELGMDPPVLGLCAAELRVYWNGKMCTFHSDAPWWTNR